MRQPLSSRRSPGFTLVELAVVLTIVAFLLASLMYTFSAQIDQRNLDATAILDYFAPLKKWLDEQNRGKPVGW